MRNQHRTLPRVTPRSLATFCACALFCIGAGRSLPTIAAPAPVAVAQVPLTIAIPAHPQVLFAFANSESVDGNLNGAILTGTGGLAANLSGLNNSSSPATYTVPAGFTAPVSGTTAGNTASYTVTVGGTQYDNSNSRLNVAKAGLTSILQTFLPNADFGLIDYQTSGIPNGYCGFASACVTWVYYMSAPGSGFTFTNVLPAIPPAVGEYVTNPCWNITLNGANPVNSNCQSLNGRYPNINTYQYMYVGASSDDPSINDVLYAPAGFGSAVCVVYNGPHPVNPFPPNFSLGNYEGGGVVESYNSEVNGCATETGPTNAGYVPWSPEVMYAERGFGYYTFSETSQPSSPTSWPPIVPMTSAGQVPTQASMNTALAAFSPYLAPETNNPNTVEVKAAATQSPIAGLLAASGDYYSSQNPASSNGCPPTRYVVLVTDGLPTMDLNGNAWPPLGSTSAAGYGVTASFNANGSLNATNDQALRDAITELTTLAAAGIKTYIIGVGAGVNPAANPTAAATMTAMAIAGGTNNYFAATTEAQLGQDMQVILAAILAANEATAAAAINTTGLNNGSIAYIAQFESSDSFQDWTGDLDAYPINAANGQVETGIGNRIWSAKVQLDQQGWDLGRLIATWDPVAGAGTPFRWNAFASVTGISTATTLGQELETFTPDTNGQDVLQFLRGNNADEQRNGGQFRNRTHKLGDIISSAPLYVGVPVGYSQSASYSAFIAAHQNRAPILYVGANDGMLHAIDAATGDERWAYIPNGVFANLIALANPYYNEQHKYYVNGTPIAADVQFSDNTWHTVLVGSEGAGGSTLFGLDVTTADQVTTEGQLASMALWEFSDPDMGLSFSQPAFAYASAGWLVFAGNGYDSPNEKPVLYAINPQTGTVINNGKIDLCAAVAGVCNMGVANGLSSVTVVNSYGEAALPADTVYAGDLQGNLWRVDISNANPSNWVVSVMYQTKDSLNNPQPITTAPAVTLNPNYPRLLGTMVFVGTGELIGFADLASTQVQTLYGLFDPPTGSGPPVGFPGIPTRANLVAQTLSASTVGATPVMVESAVNPVVLPTNRGWYVDFSLDPGERIITNPQVEAGGGVVVTSYAPNASSCTSGGTSWLSVFNYANGGSFPLPELDVANTGNLNSGNQTANGLNPVSVSLGNVYATQATIVQRACSGANCAGNAKIPNASTEHGISTPTILDRGSAKKRVGWWEVLH